MLCNFIQNLYDSAAANPIYLYRSSKRRSNVIRYPLCALLLLKYLWTWIVYTKQSNAQQMIWVLVGIENTHGVRQREVAIRSCLQTIIAYFTLKHLNKSP